MIEDKDMKKIKFLLCLLFMCYLGCCVTFVYKVVTAGEQTAIIEYSTSQEAS